MNKDPRHYRKVVELTGLPAGSLIGVPMRVKNRVTGVLEAINKKHGEFNQDDVEAALPDKPIFLNGRTLTLYVGS